MKIIILRMYQRHTISRAAMIIYWVVDQQKINYLLIKTFWWLNDCYGHFVSKSTNTLFDPAWCLFMIRKIVNSFRSCIVGKTKTAIWSLPLGTLGVVMGCFVTNGIRVWRINNGWRSSTTELWLFEHCDYKGAPGSAPQSCLHCSLHVLFSFSSTLG